MSKHTIKWSDCAGICMEAQNQWWDSQLVLKTTASDVEWIHCIHQEAHVKSVP
jgi:hypothetical protein